MLLTSILFEVNQQNYIISCEARQYRRPLLVRSVLFVARTQLYLTYRIRRSFCPREFRPREDFSLWNEMTSWRNSQSWQKFGRAGENAWHFSEATLRTA